MSDRTGNASDLQNHLQRLRVSAQPFVPGAGPQYQPGIYPAPMYSGPGQYNMSGGGPYGVPPPHMMNYPPGNYYHQPGYNMSQSAYRQQQHHHRYQDQSHQVDRWQQPQHHTSPTKPQHQHAVVNENVPTNLVPSTDNNNAAKTSKSSEVTPPQTDVESWEDIAEDTPVQKESPEERKDSPPTANRPTETAGESSNTTTDTDSQDRPRQETVDGGVKTAPTNTNSTNTSTAPVAKTTKHRDDNPPAKNVKTVVPPPKTLDEKENINIVFIGHVDAGKSTIGGHIMYLTGQVDKRTLEKYEREAKEKNRETWYLSWALDTNQEERDKGKTVEVGRAAFETEKKRFTILDAPGHAGFVPNMISGAVQADVGVLVISARRGEFETGFEKKGQTREHAMLAKTAGVKHLIVLINKMDDTTVNWSIERYEECKTKLTPFLKKVGFNPKTDIYFIPVSGLTGANLKEVAPSSVCPWYRGPALIPYLNDLPTIAREDEGPFRMPIAEKYKEMGTIVLGKVESGSVCKGSAFLLMPNRTTVEVLSVIRGEEDIPVAYSGDNVKLKLKGVEEEDVSPGFVVCSVANPCHVGRVFDAQVVILEYKSIICAGFSCVLHIHNVVEEVEIVQLIAKIDKKTGKKLPEKPKFIKQDHTAIARFQASGVICMEVFKDFPPMARFNLRDEGKTIGIGKILKIIE